MKWLFGAIVLSGSLTTGASQGCGCYVFSQLGIGLPAIPVETDETVVSFYNYDKASYNGPVEAVAGESMIFLHRNIDKGCDDSLVIVHDSLGGGLGGSATFEILAGPDLSDPDVKDDASDTYVFDGMSTLIDWNWLEGRTDGLAARIDLEIGEEITLSAAFDVISEWKWINGPGTQGAEFFLNFVEDLTVERVFCPGSQPSPSPTARPTRSPSSPPTPEDDEPCACYTFSQPDEFGIPVLEGTAVPVATSENAVLFYEYNDVENDGFRDSYNGNVPSQPGVSMIFIHRDKTSSTCDDSLVIVNDNASEGNGGSAIINVFVGPDFSNPEVKDNPGDSYVFNEEDGTTEFSWNWQQGRTDGLAARFNLEIGEEILLGVQSFEGITEWQWINGPDTPGSSTTLDAILDLKIVRVSCDGS